MKTIKVHKADGLGVYDVESLRIEMSKEFRAERHIDELDHIFGNDAQRIANALKTLPGGTLDRLVGLLMMQRASHFVVPLRESPVSVVVTSEKMG